MTQPLELNPTAAAWIKKVFVLWFGQVSPIFLKVWANSVEKALDECVDWLAENAPGQLFDEQVAAEYQRLGGSFLKKSRRRVARCIAPDAEEFYRLVSHPS